VVSVVVRLVAVVASKEDEGRVLQPVNDNTNQTVKSAIIICFIVVFDLFNMNRAASVGDNTKLSVTTMHD